MERPERREIRLSGYDYGSPGAYFLTICTRNRRCMLSEIIGEGQNPPTVRLTDCGKIADEQIRLLERRFPQTCVDAYVIMPNHMHLLLSVQSEAGGASPSPTVIDVVRVLKSQITRLYGRGGNLFQRSFYDHIVRNEVDYLEIWNYIETNPLKWREDRLYAERE